MVNIPEHPVFKRRDSDLFVESRVNAVDAMLGTELRVPTLYGDTMLDIPSGHAAGDPVQDQGEGAPQAELFRQGGRVRRGQGRRPEEPQREAEDLLKQARREKVRSGSRSGRRARLGIQNL